MRWVAVPLAGILLSGCAALRCIPCGTNRDGSDAADDFCVTFCGTGTRSHGSGDGSIGKHRTGDLVDAESGFFWGEESPPPGGRERRTLVLVLTFVDGAQIHVHLVGKQFDDDWEGEHSIPAGDDPSGTALLRRVVVMKPTSHPPVAGGTLTFTRLSKFRATGGITVRFADGSSLASSWTLRNLPALNERPEPKAGGGFGGTGD